MIAKLTEDKFEEFCKNQDEYTNVCYLPNNETTIHTTTMRNLKKFGSLIFEDNSYIEVLYKAKE